MADTAEMIRLIRHAAKLLDNQTPVGVGQGTDVRRWWPACVDYSAGDPRLSADAARYIPEAVP